MPVPLGRTDGNLLFDKRLPQRLRQPIAELEARSERLIALSQLVLVIIFGLLFLLGPRPEDTRSMMIEPVPVALTIYGVLTVGRLAVARRRPLSDLEVALSIVADVVLICWLAWAFHEQYQRAPAFSLKVPTFLYFFAFVALRALRFDPRLVLFTGLVSIVGWLTLVVTVLMQSGSGTITRSFVEYVTGDRVLVGAEVEKLAILAAVTLLTAFAIAEARRVLVRAVTEEAGAREVGRFLSKGLAETIRGADQPLQAGHVEAREIAVIMLDIRGFTRFSANVPASEAVAVLTSLHHSALAVVARHGGVVDKFIGDGIMITFGAVTPSTTAAVDALATLVEVLKVGKQWELSLPMAARHLRLNGAATCGEALFATLGAGERLEYTVIGSCVNVAAKLEQHNKVESTRGLATRMLVEQARQQSGRQSAALRDLGPRMIAGIDTSVELFAVD